MIVASLRRRGYCLRIQRNACPQWYMLRVSLRSVSFARFFHREKVDYGSCSRFSTCPFSAHCLVRQRLHAVRQFTEYFIFYVYWGGYGSSGRFSTCSFSAFAWFNSEHKFLRQSTWLVFLVTTHLALFSFVVLRPLMLDIMAGMDQKDSFMRGFWWLCDVVWW